MHKATRALVDRYEGFAVETLNIKGLMKTRMGKSFADAGLGKLVALSGVSEFPMREKCASLAWHTLRSVLQSPGQHVSTE